MTRSNWSASSKFEPEPAISQALRRAGVCCQPGDCIVALQRGAGGKAAGVEVRWRLG